MKTYIPNYRETVKDYDKAEEVLDRKCEAEVTKRLLEKLGQKLSSAKL